MLYRVGTMRELPMLKNSLPEQVYEEVARGIAILDREYGADRDYLQTGGYYLIAETSEDVAHIKNVINYDSHPFEWADRTGENGSYISVVYILNDDFSITLYIPTAIAPITIIKDMEEEK